MRWRSYFSFVFTIFLALTFFGTMSAAFAQDAVKTAPAQDKMDQVPDEYIEEAHQMFNDCAQDYSMNQYFNCECISVNFLDERVRQGPIPSSSVIFLNIKDQCRDAIGSAGVVYTDCLKSAYRFEPGTDPEKFCECVANSYVKSMNDFAPPIDSNHIVRYQTMAYASCRNRRDRLN